MINISQPIPSGSSTSLNMSMQVVVFYKLCISWQLPDSGLLRNRFFTYYFYFLSTLHQCEHLYFEFSFRHRLYLPFYYSAALNEIETSLTSCFCISRSLSLVINFIIFSLELIIEQKIIWEVYVSPFAWLVIAIYSVNKEYLNLYHKYTSL